MAMVCRGIRGATTADENSKEAIIEATKELLAGVVEANSFNTEDVAATFFTTTQDLNAEFPAVGARQMGWVDVPTDVRTRDERAGRPATVHTRAGAVEHGEVPEGNVPRLPEGRHGPQEQGRFPVDTPFRPAESGRAYLRYITTPAC